MYINDQQKACTGVVITDLQATLAEVPKPSHAASGTITQPMLGDEVAICTISPSNAVVVLLRYPP